MRTSTVAVVLSVFTLQGAAAAIPPAGAAAAEARPAYISEPKPVETEILIGAHHCPLWDADRPAVWDQVVKHPERTPVLGFYSQENPEIASRSAWALTTGPTSATWPRATGPASKERGGFIQQPLRAELHVSRPLHKESVMIRLARVSSVALLALAMARPGPAPAGPLDQQTVYFAAGSAAGTRIHLFEWQNLRRKTFAGQKVVFFDKELLLNRDRMLLAMKNADVFYYGGHSGVPKAKPDTHVLLAKPTGPGDDGLVTSAQIREALSGVEGPRLVLVSGCETTDPADGIKPENRMNNAFGISAGTRGRTYLGWSSLIVGIKADDRFGQLLDAWVEKGDDGIYPTLEEARQKVGIQNVVIIGDKNLRYKETYAVTSEGLEESSDVKVRLYWDPTGAKTAKATIEFSGAVAEKLGQFGVPMRVELEAVQQADGYAVTDPAFKKFVQQIGNALTKEASSESGRMTIDVRSASILVKPEGQRLRITVNTQTVTTISIPDQPAMTTQSKEPTELLAIPEGASSGTK